MMKVGDKVWIYDPNARDYTYDDGTKSRSPIYRKSFVENYIIGETKVSWIVSRWKENNERTLKSAKKYKKSTAHEVLTTSEKELDKRCWVHDHDYGISEAVRNCKDYDTMKKIAELVGYDK